MAKNEPEAESDLTFEQALEKLESIVQQIEQGKIGLEASIAKYEEGMRLIQRCRRILSDAEQKIQRLQLSETGQLEAEPFEPDAEA
jgi:exodeoxyribonuclease VII small subunit